MAVKPKKHLGQHFLTDESIANQIADALALTGDEIILEVGPGMGVLTKYLLQRPQQLHVVEIDRESIQYLKQHFSELTDRIISEDFLKLNLAERFKDEQIAIIGNFPYNISTQIVFKALEYKEQVVGLCGMFQKEVAQRIAEKPGSKAYGI
ncbi:UNVERIFIED_CONTAM: hypothetical protein GTU68_008460, partial [Idotea baltica]|nr:hypothetical protein [Idotea baltica]